MKKITLIVMSIALFAGMNVFSAPTLGYVETWTTVDSKAGWATDTVGSGFPTADWDTGSLLLTIPDTGSPGAKVYGGLGSEFVGNYSALESTLVGAQYLVAKFSLESLDDYNVNNGAMLMYFVGNGNTYYLNYNFTQPAPASGLVNYTVGIGAGNWEAAIAGVFADDWQSVTEFGLELWGANGGGADRYRIDNFEITSAVPEPETVWMIMMVLASLGLTFRGRLVGIADQVKARIKA